MAEMGFFELKIFEKYNGAGMEEIVRECAVASTYISGAKTR
jgi:hypothetical protein